MPYYVHPKTVENVLAEYDRVPDVDIRHYPTAQEANDNCNRSTHKVTFIASEYEAGQWRERELNRFNTHEYLPIPWEGSEETYYPFHFAHLSLKSPGLIAYTKNDEHGHNDRQTSVKPGRYLEEFYKDVFTLEQRQDYIAQCTAEALSLQIARSAEDIITVYEGGPSSCMSHPADDYRSPVHPTAVYGDSDLAVAYYGTMEHASGRALVCPAKMRYGRIYGGRSVLEQLLKAAGYSDGSMKGALIRAIETEDNNAFVMPYVDYLD